MVLSEMAEFLSKLAGPHWDPTRVFVGSKGLAKYLIDLVSPQGFEPWTP